MARSIDLSWSYGAGGKNLVSTCCCRRRNCTEIGAAENGIAQGNVAPTCVRTFAASTGALAFELGLSHPHICVLPTACTDQHWRPSSFRVHLREPKERNLPRLRSLAPGLSALVWERLWGALRSAMEEEAETARGDYTGYALNCTAWQSPFGMHVVVIDMSTECCSVGGRP